MDKQPHDGLPYWDEVAAAGNYLLDLPARIDKSLEPVGRRDMRESFCWPVGRKSVSKADYVEWARETVAPWVGRKSVGHSLTYATHWGHENIGIARLDVDVPGRRIKQASAFIIAASQYADMQRYDDPDRLDVIFRRAYDTVDSEKREREVTAVDYRMLRQELLGGVLYKADVLLRYAELQYDDD